MYILFKNSLTFNEIFSMLIIEDCKENFRFRKFFRLLMFKTSRYGGYCSDVINNDILAGGNEGVCFRATMKH